MPSPDPVVQPRLAVLPLFYGRTDVMRGCLDPLIAGRAGRYHVYAIENPSGFSDENRSILDNALRRGEVAGAYFPERNTAFNALLIALSRDLFGLAERYDHLVLSDGDVAVGPEPFVEQQALLEANPSMSSCSLRIDVRQWSPLSKHYDSTVHYAASAIEAEGRGEPYAVTAGGFWMRMFRTREILALARVFDRNAVRLRDSTIDQYFRTCGMFPACTIRSLGVELPHGPMFSARDRTKLIAARQMRRAGESDVFNNNLSPGGALHTPGGVVALPPEQTTLAVETPDACSRLATHPALPPGLQRRPVQAVVLEHLDAPPPPATVVLLFDPPLRRLLVADDGGTAMVPLSMLARDANIVPFLDEIEFDARPPIRWSKRMLPQLMAAAGRALRPGGTLRIIAPDWTAAARDYAKCLATLENAIGGQPSDVQVKALSAMKRGRPFRDVITLFEPGEIVYEAVQAGLEVVQLSREPLAREAALVMLLRRPTGPHETAADPVVAPPSVEAVATDDGTAPAPPPESGDPAKPRSPLAALYRRLRSDGQSS